MAAIQESLVLAEPRLHAEPEGLTQGCMPLAPTPAIHATAVMAPTAAPVLAALEEPGTCLAPVPRRLLAPVVKTPQPRAVEQAAAPAVVTSVAVEALVGEACSVAVEALAAAEQAAAASPQESSARPL
jgi:hypothetical protein